MKKIRTLLIVFSNEIANHEIPAVRGAIAAKVGFENDAFHNHDPSGKLLYRYPTIQYKRVQGKSAIFCLDEGVDALSAFFDRPSRSLTISGRELDMKIHRLFLDEVVFQAWTQMFDYRISRWVGLNPENLAKYNLLREEKKEDEIKALFARILIGNIITVAKGVKWDVDKRIELEVMEVERAIKAKVHDGQLIGFDLSFRTNVFLPNYIGLGKSVSLGYGVVNSLKNS